LHLVGCLFDCGKSSAGLSYKQCPAADVISYRVLHRRQNYLPHFPLGGPLNSAKSIASNKEDNKQRHAYAEMEELIWFAIANLKQTACESMNESEIA
jgi:hypothetical protein